MKHILCSLCSRCQNSVCMKNKPCSLCCVACKKICEKLRCLGSPIVRKIAWRLWFFFKLYLVVFCIVLPILTFRSPFSAYYWPRDEKALVEVEKHTNNVRTEIATNQLDRDRIFRSRNPNIDPWNLKAHNPVVLITLITMRRDSIDGYDPRYFSQTVTSTLNVMQNFQLDSGEPDYFGLVLCNIDGKPKDYAELRNISEIYKMRTFTRFLDSEPSADEKGDRHLKEKNDYVYCLRQSFTQLKPKYVLLLEDDAVPTSDAMWVIHRTIEHSLQDYSRKNPEKKLGLVKFFHPYRFFNRAVFQELFGFSALFGTILFCLHLLISKERVSAYLYLDWFFYSLFVFLIGLCLGHANLLKLRHLSTLLYALVPVMDCCTPAVLFPNTSWQLLVDYYENHTCTDRIRNCPKDLLLRPFLTATRTDGLMVLPNIFNHIGLYSAIGNKVKHPDVVN